eukprot:5773-Heterococcus_DN1.PRE.7
MTMQYNNVRQALAECKCLTTRCDAACPNASHYLRWQPIKCRTMWSLCKHHYHTAQQLLDNCSSAMWKAGSVACSCSRQMEQTIYMLQRQC